MTFRERLVAFLLAIWADVAAKMTGAAALVVVLLGRVLGDWVPDPVSWLVGYLFLIVAAYNVWVAEYMKTRGVSARREAFLLTQITALPPQELRVLREIRDRGWMNDQDIQAFCQANNLPPVDGDRLKSHASFLGRTERHGEWYVREEDAPTVDRLLSELPK